MKWGHICVEYEVSGDISNKDYYLHSIFFINSSIILARVSKAYRSCQAMTDIHLRVSVIKLIKYMILSTCKLKYVIGKLNE
jgi:hypothetical protein